MKEIIFNITADSAMATGHKVVIANASAYASLDKNHVLGILNKSTMEPHYTPMQWDDLTSVVYDSTAETITLQLASTSPAIEAGNELFVKIYQDADPLEQFFNLPEALPSQYNAMTTAEVLEIADEEWLAMYGFVAVPNTLHTVNALGQQVEIATYFKTSRTYGDYGFPELWAQNDQQQWVSILNDNPTADRDIYTYNPSNNE